jgi:PPOX class probable FMN-dependent enzyme
MPFAHQVADMAALREIYRQPHENVIRKVIDHVDDGARSFVARSPFVVVSTNGPGGVDASPRGGPPGFVTVLDDKRLALGDLAGNNRLDSFGNVVQDGAVGMLFLVPGLGETLRVNGRGTITIDPDVLDACPIDGRRPKVALGVDVQECYIHCAKAFRRSRLWDPASWPQDDERPSATKIVLDHMGLDVDPALVDAELEAGYKATMWTVGGERA